MRVGGRVVELVVVVPVAVVVTTAPAVAARGVGAIVLGRQHAPLDGWHTHKHLQVFERRGDNVRRGGLEAVGAAGVNVLVGKIVAALDDEADELGVLRGGEVVGQKDGFEDLGHVFLVPARRHEGEGEGLREEGGGASGGWRGMRAEGLWGGGVLLVAGVVNQGFGERIVFVLVFLHSRAAVVVETGAGVGGGGGEGRSLFLLRGSRAGGGAVRRRDLLLISFNVAVAEAADDQREEGVGGHVADNNGFAVHIDIIHDGLLRGDGLSLRAALVQLRDGRLIARLLLEGGGHVEGLAAVGAFGDRVDGRLAGLPRVIDNLVPAPAADAEPAAAGAEEHVLVVKGEHAQRAHILEIVVHFPCVICGKVAKRFFF